MADLALTSLLAKLELFLLEEDLLEQPGLRKRVDYIKQEAAKLREFVRAAEYIEEDSNLEQEIWIKQVRDIVYETEDFIEGFLLQMAADRLDKKSYACFNSGTSSLKAITHASNVRAVKRMKSRFRELSPMNSPFLLTAEKFTEGAAIQESYRLPLLTTKPKVYRKKGDCLVWAAKSKEQLIDLLISDDSELKVIPLVGLGGLGKTTLANHVYQDAEMKKRFQSHAWVHVSPSFRVEDLLKDLIQQLYKENKKSVPSVDHMDVIAAMEVVYNFLHKYSYIIILDDVWSVDAWEKIRYAFPAGKKGRVVITTRVTDVASAACTSRDHICNLQPLSDQESWALYIHKAFHGGPCPEHLKEVSKKILEKCAGLPLAIVAISGVLMTKDAESESDEWNQMNRRLGEEGLLRSTTNILLLSYFNLPFDLRPCFLYTCIFHEDHPIPVTKLLRLWVAERFVVAVADKTAEEVAKTYLDELLNRNLMEVAETTSDGRVKACHIHDLLRQTIIRKSRNQNFAVISKEIRGSWPDKMRRLSVHNSFLNIQNQNLHELRSLLMFEVEEPLSKKSLPMFFTEGCKLLTVLDLQGTTLSKFPSVILDMLNLKYLSLRSTNVSKIPSSIGVLNKLETLDLKRTPVSKLPTGILQLHSLRNLLVYRYESEPFSFFNTKYGVKAPKGIGNLTSLQKLSFVEGGPGKKVMLAGLAKLTMLRRLGIINLINENCETLGASLNKLSNLHALSVNCSEGEILTLPPAFPPHQLSRLYLTGQLSSLPNWIGSLQKLVKIFLKLSKLQVDPLAILEQLPNLVHIELLQAYEGNELCFKAGKFQKLKVLGIVELKSIKSVTLERTAAPNLERLTIEGCGMLKMIPSGIEHLVKLKELHFVNMPQELILSIRPDTSEGEMFRNISHIPEVTTSTYSMDGTWDVKKLSAGWSSESVGKAAMRGLSDLREK